MKYCPHCGAELEPGAKFCTKCGAKLENGPVDQPPKKNDQPASWIKAEQGGRKARQDTMVFNQNPNAKENRRRRQQSQQNVPPEPPEEDNEKKKRTNNILTGILIGLLVVAVAVGAFFIWRNRQQSSNDWSRNQNTTQSSNSGSSGNPNPGEANVLEPSASVSESVERARRDGNYRGLANDNGRTVYMNNGRIDSDFKGIVPDDRGNRYLVDSGQVRYSISDQLTDNNGQEYTIENGQVVSGPDETTTTNADDQGVDSTQYNETDNSNGAQKFDDYELDNATFINPNPPELKEGDVNYGVDSVTYDEDGNYVVTFVILNGTNKTITVHGIDNIELRNGGGDTIATGKIDDLDDLEIGPNESQTLSTTMVNESRAEDDLSNSSLMMHIDYD